MECVSELTSLVTQSLSGFMSTKCKMLGFFLFMTPPTAMEYLHHLVFLPVELFHCTMELQLRQPQLQCIQLAGI